MTPSIHCFCSVLFPAQASRAAKTPKYTYVHLDDLKAGSVVNVYGVVVFFKQPFKSRGTGQSGSRTTSSRAIFSVTLTALRQVKAVSYKLTSACSHRPAAGGCELEFS